MVVRLGSSVGRRTRQQVQTTGPGLRERLQCGAVRSIGVRAQLSEGASHDTEVDSADDLWIVMGCLEQGATAELDDTETGISTRGEPEFLKQCDHLAAGRQRTGCDRGVGTPTLVRGLSYLRSPDQIPAPRPARLDRIGSGSLTGSGDLRGQRGGQTGILAGAGL